VSFVTTQEHQQILDSDGHLLVTGGPGSGKTTTALRKALKFVGEKKISPGQKVLFLSFSRAAVSRVIGSVDDVIKNKDYKSLIQAHTFHSFFWEIVKTHGYLIGLPRKLKVLLPHEAKVRKSELEEGVSWAEEKERLMREEGLVDFSLFAPTAMNILSSSQKITEIYTSTYPLVIVDEAQDTNPEQWSLASLFRESSQLLMLADMDQQIHDYQPGVGPERMNDIIEQIAPEQISLEGQNHRNAGSDIINFARDILDTTAGGPYDVVRLVRFNPRTLSLKASVRRSVGRIRRDIVDLTGSNPESIAILSTTNAGVKRISKALSGDENDSEIPHKVEFDEGATLSASQLIGCLLEPLDSDDDNNVIRVLEQLSEYHRYKSRSTERERCNRWIEEIRAGRNPRGTVVPAIRTIIAELKDADFTGNPYNDWLKVRGLLGESNCRQLVELAAQAGYLMVFNRGKRLSLSLSNTWMQNGSYDDARKIIDSVVSEDKVLSQNERANGLYVMNFHQAKGKEFDGVILVNDSFCPFVRSNDTEPYLSSRKLVFVGITRAKRYVYVLQSVMVDTPITSHLNLNRGTNRLLTEHLCS
jgi:DNA helicase-2/ATP-dependent DNA helicase PcrA